jgi:hypothetical protein
MSRRRTKASLLTATRWLKAHRLPASTTLWLPISRYRTLCSNVRSEDIRSRTCIPGFIWERYQSSIVECRQSFVLRRLTGFVCYSVRLTWQRVSQCPPAVARGASVSGEGYRRGPGRYPPPVHDRGLRPHSMLETAISASTRTQQKSAPTPGSPTDRFAKRL